MTVTRLSTTIHHHNSLFPFPKLTVALPLLLLLHLCSVSTTAAAFCFVSTSSLLASIIPQFFYLGSSFSFVESQNNRINANTSLSLVSSRAFSQFIAINSTHRQSKVSSDILFSIQLLRKQLSLQSSNVRAIQFLIFFSSDRRSQP